MGELLVGLAQFVGFFGQLLLAGDDLAPHGAEGAREIAGFVAAAAEIGEVDVAIAGGKAVAASVSRRRGLTIASVIRIAAMAPVTISTIARTAIERRSAAMPVEQAVGGGERRHDEVVVGVAWIEIDAPGGSPFAPAVGGGGQAAVDAVAVGSEHAGRGRGSRPEGGTAAEIETEGSVGIRVSEVVAVLVGDEQAATE